MIYGLPKILDNGKTQGSFKNMGLPQDLAILIWLLVFIGGLVILLGVFTKIAIELLAINITGVRTKKSWKSKKLLRKWN